VTQVVGDHPISGEKSGGKTQLKPPNKEFIYNNNDNNNDNNNVY